MMALTPEIVERFKGLESQVIDPVPQEKRGNYRYWRAADLGKIALNVNAGNLILNSRPGWPIQFYDNYSAARTRTELLSGPENPLKQSKLTPHEQSELDALVGVENFN